MFIQIVKLMLENSLACKIGGRHAIYDYRRCVGSCVHTLAQQAIVRWVGETYDC